LSESSYAHFSAHRQSGNTALIAGGGIQSGYNLKIYLAEKGRVLWPAIVSRIVSRADIFEVFSTKLKEFAKDLDCNNRLFLSPEIHSYPLE
jgi:hypothetical protein